MDVGVRFVSEPQAAPVQPEPESDHVTLWFIVLLLLLVTAAVTFTVWPCSMVGPEAGLVMATLIDELELPPQPAAKKPVSIPSTAQNKFSLRPMATTPLTCILVFETCRPRQ